MGGRIIIMNVLSLFDGMSCGQLALTKANIEYHSYYASEIDDSAMRVAKHNFPNTIHIGNVLNIKTNDLPKIDLMIGGSPCQGFSQVGKGYNFNDPRSILFFQYVRILRECNPKYFLLENVCMKKEWANVISDHLQVDPIMIDGGLVSAATRRRLYWTNIPYITQPQNRHITFDDINQHDTHWMAIERVNKIAKWKTFMKPYERAIVIGTKMKVGCLVARGYNEYASSIKLITDGKNYRTLTHEEAELCMGIPVGYTSIANDRERSRMIGNGWNIDVVAHIFNHIKNPIQYNTLEHFLT